MTRTRLPASSRSRAALLGSAATLAIALAAPAHAQQTVVLNEGTTQQNVALNGADRLVVNIDRIDASSGVLNLGAIGDRPAVLSGSMSSAQGDDTLWLRATGSQTRNIVHTQPPLSSTRQYASGGGLQFIGGTVYEASGNDTILTLENRSRSTNVPPSNDGVTLRYEALRLAGDGVIELTFAIQAEQPGAAPDQAIIVESGSTLSREGTGGDGKLDVVVRNNVTGNEGLVGGSLNADFGLIDARNANSIRFASGSVVRSGNNHALLAGEADVFIERGSTFFGTSAAGGVLVRTAGRVENRGKLDATNNGSVGNAVGVLMEGAELYNGVTEGETGSGEIIARNSAVVAAVGDNYIENVGVIRATQGAAIETRGGSVVTRNAIHTFANGSRRLGEISGSTQPGQKTAYRDTGSTQDLIVNSGVITGDVLMGGGSDTFLYTEATNGVTGKIDGGGDVTDAYGRSVSTSGAITFDNNLNNGTTIVGFNMHGLELNGSNLSATLQTAAGVTLNDGIKILGAGNVTNNARINDADGVAIFLEHFKQLPDAGIDFVNSANIQGLGGFWAQAQLNSFRNTATMTGRDFAFAYTSYLYNGVTRTFDFLNEGELIGGGGGGNGALTAGLYGRAGNAPEVLASFRNTNVIRATRDVEDPTAITGGKGVYMTSDASGAVKFNNTGTIEATGGGAQAMRLQGGRFDVVNDKLIHGAGPAAAGVVMVMDTGEANLLDRFVNTSNGVVRATGGGFTGGVNGRALGVGFAATEISNGRTVQVDNAGLIEAKDGDSIAVAAIGIGDVDSANFVLNNTGTIHGGDDTTIAQGEEVSDRTLNLQDVLDDESIERVVAGAIQTFGTTDRIRNSGTIIGSVDLGDGNDRFEHYGSLDGDVRMGNGDDTFVFGGGSITAGKTVSGGNGTDLILADMSSNTDKVIDAAVFKGFEQIHRLDGALGTAKLFLKGEFDVTTLAIRDLMIHVAAGDTVTSQSGRIYISGSDAEEHIVNLGTIVGGVSLGAGSDTINNSGTMGGSGLNLLNMDDGDDRIINSGTLNFAGVYMGDGQDEISNSGLIAGFIDLSGGDDILSNAAGGAIRLGVSTGVGNDRIVNAGLIEGGVSLDAGDDALTNEATGTISGAVLGGNGNDHVVNAGRIDGDLDLGAGDDRYEQVGTGSVGGAITGGDGNDTFVFRLQGQRGSIPSGFDGFESFAAYGPGTLALALDRPYNTLEILEGANLELTNAATHSVQLIKGDDSSQSVKIDAGFNGSVQLFGGADTLEMSLGGLLAGDLDGGTDSQGSIDTLKLNLTADSTINNLFGFEAVQVNGPSSLTLAGTLGEGQTITFDGGNNEFIIAENAVFEGSADGGAGSDILRVTTGAAASRTIVSGQLTSFESLYASGAGTLEFSGGNHRFNTFQVDGGNVAFMNGAKLAAGSGSILFTGSANNRFTLGYGSSIGSRVDGGDGDRDVLEFNQGAGQTQKVSDLNAENFEILAASGAGYLNIDQDVTFTEVQIEGGNVKVLKDVTLTADVIGGAGADTFDNAGTVTGDVLLGLGDDTYIARTGSSVTGVVDGGVGGNDTVVYSLIDGAGSLLDDFINFESLGVYGPGTLSLDMQQGDSWNSVKLLEGANLDLKSSGGTIGQIIGDDSSQTVTVDGALTGGVDLGGGDDTLNLTLGGVLSGNLDGGAGDGDILNLKLTSESRINGMYNFETANISGGHALTLGGALGSKQRINFDGSDDELIIAAGATFEGTVDGGAGQNLLRVQSGAAENRTVVASQILNFQDLISEGAGMLALTGGNYSFDSVQVDGGSLELGANTVLKSKTRVTFDGADNRLVLGAGSSLEGGVDAGAGNDTIALAQASGQVRTWSTLQATGFERLESSGAGELRFDINADFVNGMTLNGGLTTIAAPATVTANVTGSDAAETFAILGTLNGDLDLGAGDDRLIFAANGSGQRSGGAGTDTLEFRGAGSAPVSYDASLWTSFEKLAVSGGVLSMTGVSDWQGLTLTGGRLVGQAGSVITSSSAIEVGAGSVFGSAGTVNADINVRGTLSPGASPGTMTVNGDVSFFAGSNLLMELSPQASDLLMINGAMNIANGATIDITGVLPSTPGQVLDLIVASDGINGRFTTVNKSSSVFGFVSQNGNKLQIRGEFQNNAGFGSNAQNSISYANAVLGSGQAVQAFTQAVPVLVDANGVSNAAAFAQLTPEAYGSAMAMQTETALSGVDAGRSLLAETPRQAGKFAFARGYGASTGLEGRASTGAASADIDLGAAYAGVGYVSPEGGVVGGFVGFTNSEQSLKDLGAETKADGMIAGAFLGGELGGVRMGAQMTYERSDASTSRLISAAGGTAKGEYDMESVAIDASMSYPIAVSGWTVAPTVGATWISARRDAVSETGATSFGLAVDQDRSDTLFTDIGIRASTVMTLGGNALTPFAEIGVRTIQNDGGERVTGTIKGVNGFEMDVDGVRRDRSVARVATGVSYDLGGVRFDAGYAGEFGDATRHNFGAGVAVRF